jgi:AAT family amino acid transporter
MQSSQPPERRPSSKVWIDPNEVDASLLTRGLSGRQMSMMALGSTIGAGLFLGSATAIQMAGPAILIAYLIGGVGVFVIMRALGEMAIHRPVAGSFARYANDYLGPLAGYLTGWNYWFMWIVTCVAEITAIGIYMRVWFPDVPQWVWALSALSSMSLVNLVGVRAFGEFEFWFSAIKVLTIVAMIAAGIAMITVGLGNGGVPTGIAQLWSNGGFFPHGIKGMLLSMQMVMFAYLGVEMVGLTAGEAKDPSRSIPRAINSIFWRILIFYVGALFVIMALYPWDKIGTNGSPFVNTFQKLGIRSAAGIINFVVLTAALSSCNGGIYSTGRMLYNLAAQRHAPRTFARVSSSGLPVWAIVASIAALLMGVLLNFMVPARVFVWVTSIATFAAIWTWLVILVAHLRFRRSTQKRSTPAVGARPRLFPLASYATMCLLGAVLGLMAWSDDTRIALVVGPLWIIGLIAVHVVGNRRFVTKSR